MRFPLAMVIEDSGMVNHTTSTVEHPGAKGLTDYSIDDTVSSMMIF